VKLAKVALFTAGYVIGARAGRERYVQIVDGLAKASERLEEYSARHAPAYHPDGAGPADRDPRSQEAPV
jgi:hypothetical protein